MKRCWRHLNLSQRIVLPFLAVCLSVFILAIFVLGYWFTSVLEQNIRTEVEVFAERAEQDFRYMQKIIKTQVDLVGNQDALRQAIERRDKIALLQVLLPLKAVLGFDWVKVVDPAGNILMDVRKDGLNQAQIFDVAVSNSTRFGADFTDFVGVKWDGKPAVLLVASQPIKKQRLLGGLIVGRLVDDALLQTIAAGSSKQLLALVNQQVIATTVSQAASVTLQAPDAQNSTQQMVLADQQYFVKSFGVRGSSAAFSVLVLYPIALLNITKQTLWLQLGLLFLLGGTIVTVVGNRIAQAIARPILRLTSITQQLADGDATVRVTSTSNDEVGQLGRAFNQMAEQMAERGLLNQQIHQLQQTLDELEKNQDQLIHTEKMSSLGQLVAGIAHEVNTPLGAIRASISNVNSSLEQALKELPPLLQALSPEHLNHFFTLLDWAQQPKEQLSSREERQLKRTLKQTLAALEISHLDALADKLSKMGISVALDPILPLLQVANASSILETAYQLSVVQNNSRNIQLAVDRAARIVYALKSYVRQDISGIPIYAAVSEQVDTVLTLYQNQIKGGIEVQKNIYGTIPLLLCHPEELIQVWSNLVSNAIQAMNYQGELAIAISTQNQYVVFTITDSGSGISDEVKVKMFEPFFTTKPVGEGTGLGLSIVRKIVDKHHGKIDVYSQPGHTVFQVQLPINGEPSVNK